MVEDMRRKVDGETIEQLRGALEELVDYMALDSDLPPRGEAVLKRAREALRPVAASGPLNQCHCGRPAGEHVITCPQW